MSTTAVAIRTSCSRCVVETCVSCAREAHCELVEEACTVCVEADERDEVESLLWRVERCRREGAFAEGFDSPDDTLSPYDGNPQGVY
ncbi:MAG: hypothetical protein MAG715_00957 [Methanonatronarchaeales archaeon]|nr:hypothetical protein [Methanonatronarchaeales archaeon]